AGIEPLVQDEFPRVAALKRFLAQPAAWQSRQLMAGLAATGRLVERIADLERELSQIERTDYAPVALIDGDVLTELGLKPGPLFKRILNEVYDAQLEGRVNSTADAIAMAQMIAKV